MKKSTFIRRPASGGSSSTVTGIRPMSGTTATTTASTPHSKLPAGTKPSVHNAQLLVSTGLSDLDVILGGGVPLGALLLIEEDPHSRYSSRLVDYFISEGIANGHSTLHIGSDPAQELLSRRLPFILDDSEPCDSRPGAVRCHSFDLSRPLLHDLQAVDAPRNAHARFFDISQYQFADSTISPLPPSPPTSRTVFRHVYQEITKSLQNCQMEQGDARVARVAIESIGSPLLPTTSNQHFSSAACEFMWALRGAVRSSGFGICLVCVAKSAVSDSVLRRMEHASDIVVDLDSFVGSGGYEEAIASFGNELSGFLRLKKLPHLNSLTSMFAPESNLFGFKMSRRRVHIEKISLPPEQTRQLENRKPAATSKSLLSGSKKSSQPHRTTEKDDSPFDESGPRIGQLSCSVSITSKNPLEF